jgi:hypothetical protein
MSDIVSSLASAVIFLFAEGGQQPLGTAFVVGYPSAEHENLGVPFIVTAKHVIADQHRVVGRFSPREGNRPVEVTYDLDELRRRGDFWVHPDSGVDIAVFRTLHYRQANYLAIPLSSLATKEILGSYPIHVGDNVIFPSLLVNFMGTARNYPVVRKGSVALMPDEKVPMRYHSGKEVVVTQQEVILLDATATLGASGSPVFLAPESEFKTESLAVSTRERYPFLLGVIHGFYPALPREILENSEVSARGYFSENSGVAIVFPASLIREIMESDRFKNRIRKLGAESPRAAPSPPPTSRPR